jgi:hypothetical protein
MTMTEQSDPNYVMGHTDRERRRAEGRRGLLAPGVQHPNALRGWSEDIPAPWIERVEKLRTDILRQPLIQRSEPED